MTDITKELSEEERRFKEEWNKIAFLIKRDLADVWTDEARKYFTDLQHESKRIAFIFRRLHSHYRANTPDQYSGYYYEMHNLKQFIKNLNNIQSKKEWISLIHNELQEIINNIETEINNAGTLIKTRGNQQNFLEQIRSQFSRYFGTSKEISYREPIAIRHALSADQVEIHENLIQRFQGVENLIKVAGDLWTARLYYKIRNAEYLISYPKDVNEYENPWVFIWVRISGQEKFYFNVYYYSGTHQIWRLAYAQYGVLAKGYPESAVNAPNELQVVLSRTDFMNKYRLLKATVHPKQFVPVSSTTEPLSSDYQYFEEFQIFRKQIKSVKIKLDKVAIQELEGFKQRKYRKPENVRLKDYKYNPDYARVLAEFESDGVYRRGYSQTIYGKVVCSINGKIEYLFLYDQYGRIWIGNIDIPSSPITRYGVRKYTILVPHELDKPVNCYTDELPVEYVKDKRSIWSDASPYLDKIPIIRDFREHFGIVKMI